MIVTKLGRVVAVKPAHNFGFIRFDPSANDIYFNVSVVADGKQLFPGDAVAVSFDDAPRSDRKRMAAISVERIEEPLNESAMKQE